MEVEETSVCIIGGPVGTLLSALLSRNYGVPNVVLERDTSIPTDPRAFSLTENGVRCLQAVGLYDKVYHEIGGARMGMEFISGKHHDINAPSFFQMKLTDTGTAGHLLNLMFDQPEMERHLRKTVQDSSAGEYREGAEVSGIEENASSATVTYKDVRTGERRHLRAKFVVGTDGKRGFTRKMYMEPRGVKMEYSHPYEAVYAGGNLNVKAPAPKTHPEFPLWQRGYSSQDVVDLFVPEAFHFMCNPSRQCIMSRFGTEKDGVVSWRYEFKTLPGEDPDFLAQPEQVRKMLSPYMVHQGSKYGLKEDIAFPEDCLEIRRTWHYKFEARTCTKFHLGRIFLAGDAAHVFPPFGGQGITTGFLDAMGLAWRLVIALSPQNVIKDGTALFNAWESERRTQIQQALNLTMERGATFDETNPIKIFCRDWMLWIMQRIPGLKEKLEASQKQPPTYQYVEGMSFFPNLQGGVSFSQIYLVGPDGQVRFSDDVVFGPDKESLFQIVVLVDNLEEVTEAANALKKVEGTTTKSMMDEATYVVHDLEAAVNVKDGLNIARIASAEEFNNSPLRSGRIPAEKYDAYLWKRQHQQRRYIVVRADRFVFAACRDTSEVSRTLAAIDRVIGCGTV